MASNRMVRLTDEAVTDFAAILQYTLENRGSGQLDRYQDALDDALNALAMFPMMRGSVSILLPDCALSQSASMSCTAPSLTRKFSCGE